MKKAHGSDETGMKLFPKNIEIRTCLIICLCLLILMLMPISFLVKKLKSVQATIPMTREAVAEPFVIPVEDGVWRTIDPGGSGGTLSYAMHPVSGTLLVTSDMYQSLLRSKDGTRTYQAIAPDGHPTVSPIVPHPKKAGVWYAGFSLGNEQGLARSEDDGETWSLLHHDPEAGSGYSFGLIMDTQPDTIIWNFGSKGLMISRDQGKTFKDFSQGLSLENMYGQYEETSGKSPIVAIDNKGDTIIYLACKNGVFKRGLNGSQWEKIEDLPSEKAISLAYDGQKKWLWAGFENGLIYCGDLVSGQWEKASEGPPEATILRTHPGKPGWIWCFSHGRAGLFVSKDRGQSWEGLTRFPLYDSPEYKGNVPPSFRYRNKVTRDVFFMDPHAPDTLYLGQIYVSYNGGISWELGATRYLPEKQAWHGNGLTLLTSYKAWWDQTNPNRVYLGFSDTGLMRSNDRGYSIQTLWKEKYPELYPLAYWKNQMLDTSGSCMAFAADPEYPDTLYYGMSCKGDSSGTCGILFMSNHGGAFWEPVMPKASTLPNGIITDLVLQAGNGFNQRKLYALVNSTDSDNMPESGIYCSMDNGISFTRLAGSHYSPLTFPLMSLDYCKDNPDIMYMASSTRGGKRPAKRIRKSYDQTGGIFKSLDAGQTWVKTGGEELAGAVEVAVHPKNPDIAYTAVVPGKDDDKGILPGGIYKTMDGGRNWKMVLSAKDWLPEKRKDENAEPTSIAINPELPDIVYAVIRFAGVLRSTNAGMTWEQVDWEHLKKYQGNYHTLTINPHDPAEFYLSLFGNSFLAYRDPVADTLLKTSSKKKNLIRNGDFELTDQSGKPVYWTWNNLGFPFSEGEPILSIEASPDKTGKSLRIKMDEGSYSDKNFTGKGALPITFLSNQLSPYGVSLMRGRRVKLRYEVYAKNAKFKDLPVLSLIEIKNGVSEIKAELPAIMGYGVTPYDRLRIKPGKSGTPKWVRLESVVDISENVNTVRLVLFSTEDNDKTDVFFDNIELEAE